MNIGIFNCGIYDTTNQLEVSIKNSIKALKSFMIDLGFDVNTDSIYIDGNYKTIIHILENIGMFTTENEIKYYTGESNIDISIILYNGSEIKDCESKKEFVESVLKYNDNNIFSSYIKGLDILDISGKIKNHNTSPYSLRNTAYDYIHDKQNSKYVILKHTKTRLNLHYGIFEVYRIMATKDFGDVKLGDIGGWVSSYDNLDGVGTCWVYDESYVLEDASVRQDAKILKNSYVRGNVIVTNTSKVQNSYICDYAVVSDNCTLSNVEAKDFAIICGNSVIDYSSIANEANIKNSKITNSILNNNSKVYESIVECCNILNYSKVIKSTIQFCTLKHNSSLYDTKIACRIEIATGPIINGDIKNIDDIMSIVITDSLIFFKNKKGKISVQTCSTLFDDISKFKKIINCKYSQDEAKLYLEAADLAINKMHRKNKTKIINHTQIVTILDRLRSDTLGYSREKLADKIGYTQSELTMFETDCDSSIDTLVKIANALGYNVVLEENMDYLK